MSVIPDTQLTGIAMLGNSTLLRAHPHALISKEKRPKKKATDFRRWPSPTRALKLHPITNA